MKCTYYNNLWHFRVCYQILHPKLKPNFSKEHEIFQKDPQNPSHKSNCIAAANNAATASTKGLLNFTKNPVALIKMSGEIDGIRSDGMFSAENDSPIALLGNFPGFLVEINGLSHEEIQVS